MKSLEQQLASYAAYHQTPANKVTHFFGVPLVTFSLLLLLSMFRFVHAVDYPVTAGTVFYASVLLYYVWLDWKVALVQAPFTGALLWLADWVARFPLDVSAVAFGATFLGGWAIQLLGHLLERRRPAVTDNLLQAINAPLFLVVEVLTILRMRAAPVHVFGEASANALLTDDGQFNAERSSPPQTSSDREHPTS